MRFLPLLLLFNVSLFAQSYLLSTIPLPKTYIQNLDIYDCNASCMQEYIDHEQIFSFLAHATERVEDEKQNEARLIYVSLFNLGANRDDNSLKIALLLPYKIIGRYAASTTNSVFAYMLAKNRSFELKTFQVESEDSEDIAKVLEEIENDKFYYVIAPVTKKGALNVAQYNPDLNVYFPTINQKDLNVSSPYLYFGGIDYEDQIDTLLEYATSPLGVFYDASTLGNKLNTYTKEAYLYVEDNSSDLNTTLDVNLSSVVVENEYKKEPSEIIIELTQKEQEFQIAKDAYLQSIVNYEVNETNSSLDTNITKEKLCISFPVQRRTTNLSKYLKDNDKIQDGSFFLNTPIVKSGMVMTQLTLFDINVTNILSTQINYDPLLLNMTQYQDRDHMIIANSIAQNNNILIEANAMLNNDIVYDWINYASTIGVDLFFHIITNSPREYKLKLEENQIKYPVSLVVPSYARFTAFDPQDFLNRDRAALELSDAKEIERKLKADDEAKKKN